MDTAADRIYTRDFVLASMGAFGFFTSFMLLLGVLPLYLKDLGGSDAEVGLIIGVFALSALVPRPWIGRSIDRGGVKKFLLIGAAIFAVASGLYALATTVLILLAIRVFHGAGMAFFTTSAYTFVAELAPEGRRGEAMGLWSTVPVLATAFAPALGLEIRNRAGDDAVFFTSVGLAIVGLGLLSLVREHAAPHKSEHPAGKLLEFSVWVPALLVLAFTWLQGTISSFVLLYAEEQDIQQAGLYFTSSALAILASRVFAGKLSDRLGRWAIILPSLGLMALALVTLSFTSSLAMLILTGVLFGLAAGAGQPALTALAIDLAPPGRRGAAMGTFTATFELGMGAGAIVMGWIATQTGYSTMFLIGSAAPVLALILGLSQSRAASARASTSSSVQLDTLDG